VSAGLDTNVERQTARGNIATTQASLSDLDGQITTVRYQLAALLGKGPDRGLQIAAPVMNPSGTRSPCPATCRPTSWRAAPTSSPRAGRWKPRCTT
jgi:outer membrane protein TolC